MKPFLIFLILIVHASIFKAQYLDPSFSTDGYDVQHIGTVSYSYKLVLQADNKIISAGTAYVPGHDYDFVVMRYTEEGMPDITFGEDGISTIDFSADEDHASSLVLQDDGKILIAGTSNNVAGNNFGIVRLNTDGSIDTTFAENGFLLFQPENKTCGIDAACLQPDGKIIAAGNTNDSTGSNIETLIARFQANGKIDSTFGINGLLYLKIDSNRTSISCAEVSDENKILIGGGYWPENGADFFLARLNSNGDPDTSFNHAGYTITDLFASKEIISSIAITPEGKIIGAGNSYDELSYSGFGMARWNEDGTLDNSFGIGGKSITEFDYDLNEGNDYANDLVIQPDGKLVVAGYRYDFLDGEFIAIARYLVNGVLDISFGDGGKILSKIGSNCFADAIALNDEGKILISGASDNSFLIARFLSEDATSIANQHTNQIPVLSPNPCASVTFLSYTLTEKTNISICLYDQAGKKITGLVENKMMDAGKYAQTISFPDHLPAGNYFIEITSDIDHKAIHLIKTE